MPTSLCPWRLPSSPLGTRRPCLWLFFIIQFFIWHWTSCSQLLVGNVIFFHSLILFFSFFLRSICTLCFQESLNFFFNNNIKVYHHKSCYTYPTPVWVFRINWGIEAYVQLVILSELLAGLKQNFKHLFLLINIKELMLRKHFYI